jgi:predicted AlkP superfamily phosphohydrolase/phosphomutase
VTTSNHPRVLIVGLDGATFDVIQPLVAQGRLPHLSAMMERGTWGGLRSTIPSITPTAWTSFATGKGPGKHGLFDFQILNPHTYELTPARGYNHGHKTLWRLLTEAGRSSIILDVPFTFPPEPIQGIMVSGYGTPRTPGTTFTHPPELADELRARYGDFQVALPRERFDRSQSFFSEWDEVLASRQRVAVDLVDERDWDLFMVVLSVTDNLAHAVWTYYDPGHPNYYTTDGPRFRQAFEASYEKSDAFLGALIVRALGADVIVMSDHGFGTGRPRQYLFNALVKGGFLHYGGAGGGRLAHLATNLYIRFPRLRESVKNLAPGNRRQLKRVLGSRRLMPGLENVDLTRSKVLPANFGLQLYIHRSDRFAQGPVPPSKAEEVCQMVTEYLLSLRDRVTGEPVIQRIYRAEEIYPGPRLDQAPDLVIEYTNMYRPTATEPRLNPTLDGCHEPQGIFLAHGPHFGQSHPDGARLEDLAPTVLHLLGLPVPEDMDGRVMSEILAHDFVVEHPVQSAPSAFDVSAVDGDYSAEERADVDEQLRALGYIG